MNLSYSQSPTPEILAIPFIEENDLNPTHSPTVEDQVNSFVLSATEPQDTRFSNTFNIIDSTYKNVKYQKNQRRSTIGHKNWNM